MTVARSVTSRSVARSVASSPIRGGGGVPGPTIIGTFVASNLTPDVGNDVTFTLTLTSVAVGTYTFQLTRNNVDVPGATTNPFTLTSWEEADDGDYRIVVTDSGNAEVRTFGPVSVVANEVVTASAIRFGDLTPAGEGEQSIIAADGTYSVGGGSFSVAANRINVATMPAVGTYAVDGVDVEVVAAARTCSTTAEIAYLWLRPAAFHPVGTKILIAPGTYDVFPSLSGSSRLMNNWIWEGLDQSNRPTITSSATGLTSYFPNAGSPGFTFRYVNFYREQDLVDYLPWNPVGRDIFTINNSVVNVTFDQCRMYGNFTPAGQGGKMTTKLVGLSTSEGTSTTSTNCEYDHLCTGVRLAGQVVFTNNTIHDIYSDFFEGRTSLAGTIENNHCYNKIGDGTFLHGDWFQLQTPPGTPASGPLVYRGNTHAPGQFWNLAAGQGDAAKANSNPTFTTAGPHTMNIVDHHAARHVFLRVEDAGGTMAITLDAAATYGEYATFVFVQVGVGTITITLTGGDTAEQSLTMASNNQSRSFVSDGVSHWSRLAPGYRGNTQRRFASRTLGALEKDTAIFADSSSGPTTYTLPSGTTEYTVSVKKDDVSANLISIALPAGQTFTDHGVAGLTTNRTLSRCGEVMLFSRAEGTSVWIVSEKTTTSQGFFSGGAADGWDNLEVCYNIFFVNSPNGFRPDDDTGLGAGVFRNSKCYNNTFLRSAPPDANGDGFIAESDSWATGTVGTVHVYDGVDTFRNAFTGNLTDNGPTLRKAENQPFGWSDPEDLAALNVFLAASVPTDLRPTTRAETVAAARAITGGPLVVDAPSYSFIGAVGTTSANGPYNWDTGAVNTNTKAPLLTSMLPVDGATDVPTNTTIRLNFDELVTLGTGNISIRTVGGAEIEAFNVATSDRIVFSGNGVTLVITPTAELPVSTNVCVRIAATAIDGYFNSFAGITDDSLDFTTGAAPLDPEMLPDPGFDDAAQWRSGATSLPHDGWSVAGSLASKAGGTGTFRPINVAADIAVSVGVVYRGIATVGTITTALGSLRVQLIFFDGATQLQSTNSQTLLSALSPAGTVTHDATAPAGTTHVRLLIVATNGNAVFTVSDASLQAV